MESDPLFRWPKVQIFSLLFNHSVAQSFAGVFTVRQMFIRLVVLLEMTVADLHNLQFQAIPLHRTLFRNEVPSFYLLVGRDSSDGTGPSWRLVASKSSLSSRAAIPHDR